MEIASGKGKLAIPPDTMHAFASANNKVIGGMTWSGVTVWTDHPAVACMASQYAGWSVSVGKFFAMGSGPMRASAGKEPLFDTIGHRERADVAVGVLDGYSAVTGSGAAIRVVFDDPADWQWALDLWRSLAPA